MLMKLHRNAVTTPRQRAYIQASDKSVAALARELGINGTTVRRWKARSDTADHSSIPHRIVTSFSFEEEEIALELRSRLGLSIDDALEVMHRCLRADISRAALYRLWRRHGIAGRLPPDQVTANATGHFAAEPFGYVHADLKHLTRLEGHPAYVFVVIERTTRFVHVEILPERSADTVSAAFARFLNAFGHPIHTVLTDNGAEFTDRFGAAQYTTRQTGTGRHPFDRLCQRQGIRHRLTKPYHPQTNGMVERFNRRLSEAIAAKPANRRNAGKTASPPRTSETPSSSHSSTTIIEPDCDASTIRPPPKSSLTSRNTTRRQGPRCFVGGVLEERLGSCLRRNDVEGVRMERFTSRILFRFIET